MKHKTEEPFPGFLRTTQTRPRDEPGGRFYDPGRDVAHLADPVLGIACGLMDDDPATLHLRETLEIKDAELMAAVQAAVDFVRLDDHRADGPPPQTFKEHAAASGLERVDPRAWMLLMAAVGELFLVAGWQGKRAASAYDSAGRKIAPVDTGAEVAAAAAELRRRLVHPRPLRERLRLARLILWGGR